MRIINKNWIYPTTFLLCLCIFLSLFIGVTQTQNRQEIEILESETSIELDRKTDAFVSRLNLYISGLFYMSDSFSFFDNEKMNDEKLTNHWISFIDKFGLYDQARFINSHGDEVIRVDYSKENSYATPLSELQNKKGRYYFTETMSSKKDTVFLSYLDLNVEHGEVEQPIVPTVRLGLRYSHPDSLYDGMIMINCYASQLLEMLCVSDSDYNAKTMLINSNGGWIINESNPESEWAFMYPEKKGISFNEQFPIEWQTLQSSSEGVVDSENGLFFYKKINVREELLMLDNVPFLDIADTESYYLISYLPPSSYAFKIYPRNISATILNLVVLHKGIIILFIILSAIITFIVQKYNTYKRHIKYISDHDSLTMLYNRRAGIQKARQLIKELSSEYTVSACFIDVNGLKVVNDTLGHKAGDELISTVAKAITSSLRLTDVAMRMGGDEFLLLLKHRKGSSPENVWQRILEYYENINNTAERAYVVSASHGISFPYTDGVCLEDMIQNADEKMYVEKKRIKQGLEILRVKHKK